MSLHSDDNQIYFDKQEGTIIDSESGRPNSSEVVGALARLANWHFLYSRNARRDIILRSSRIWRFLSWRRFKVCLRGAFHIDLSLRFLDPLIFSVDVEASESRWAAFPLRSTDTSCSAQFEDYVCASADIYYTWYLYNTASQYGHIIYAGHAGTLEVQQMAWMVSIPLQIAVRLSWKSQASEGEISSLEAPTTVLLNCVESLIIGWYKWYKAYIKRHIHTSIYLPIYLSIHPSICLSIHRGFNFFPWSNLRTWFG